MICDLGSFVIAVIEMLPLPRRIRELVRILMREQPLKVDSSAKNKAAITASAQSPHGLSQSLLD